MKIVIDISKEEYLKLIKTDENGEKEIPLSLLMSLWDSVKYNCTPLPKGHGDLIDRRELIKSGVSKGFCDWYDEIKYADTIIEADKEDE